MASWARPGVKCVYTGVIPLKNKKVIPLVVGHIYTIRDVFRHPTRDVIGVHLEEVRNSVAGAFGIERGYRLDGFRPIVTQSDDVAKFTHLLNTTKQTESV